MKLAFLGTCSGTEPVRGFRHVSFALTRGGTVYFFDAGEGCSYTAHLLGVDLLKTRAVFISHCHMDHVGGLPNLLWNINKMDGISKDVPSPMEGKEVLVFIPNEDSWLGMEKVLRGTEGGFRTRFEVSMRRPEKGKIFEEDGFEVSALPNLHLGKDPGNRGLSFSYRIKADGKSIVYSGDVKNVRELEPILGRCELLLMETGHHGTGDVCFFIKEKAAQVKKLCFIHHGRAILASPEKEMEKAKDILGDRVFMARDGMELEI